MELFCKTAVYLGVSIGALMPPHALLACIFLNVSKSALMLVYQCRAFHCAHLKSFHAGSVKWNFTTTFLIPGHNDATGMTQSVLILATNPPPSQLTPLLRNENFRPKAKKKVGLSTVLKRSKMRFLPPPPPQGGNFGVCPSSQLPPLFCNTQQLGG